MGIVNDNKKYWERELPGSKQVLTLDQDLFPPQTYADSEFSEQLALNFEGLNIDSEDVATPTSRTTFEKQYFSEKNSIFGNGYMDLESLREEDEDDYIEMSPLDKHSSLNSELSIRSNNKSRSNSNLKTHVNNRASAAPKNVRIASAAPKKLSITNQLSKRSTPTKQSMAPVMELNSFSFANSKPNIRSLNNRKVEQCSSYGKSFTPRPSQAT